MSTDYEHILWAAERFLDSGGHRWLAHKLNSVSHDHTCWGATKSHESVISFLKNKTPREPQYLANRFVAPPWRVD